MSDHQRCTPENWDTMSDQDLATLALIAISSTPDRDSLAQRIAIYFYGCTTTLYSTRPEKIREMELSFLNQGGNRNE